MKKTLVLSCVLALSSLFSTMKADEGMWLIGNIPAKTDSLLHTLGLELTSEELYSEDGPSLNHAIIQLGGFCSGVVVSDEGLVFTNHHCGFDAIQNHSTTKHDYLTNGFVAKTYADELPNDGLYVLFHLKTVDVTDIIIGAIPEDADDEARSAAIDSVSSRLMQMVDYSAKGIQSEVNPFYKGSKYFLSVYQRYDDVRLVFAPPQCLGKYGGDTDNWMWPRQTCDFSVFRIYADKNNNPAEYSEDNVPYHPLAYAHVSTQGYYDGSYAMTLGYPGSTDRYLSSYGIQSTMATENDVRYNVRTVILKEMDKSMAKSDALRIMYASKHASIANYWKFSLGQNQALENLGVINEKLALEAEVNEWAKADVENRGKYIGITDSLKQLYDACNPGLKDANMWYETFLSGSDICSGLIMYAMGRYGDIDIPEFVAKAYKDVDPATDREMLKAAVRYYVANVNDKNHIPEVITAYADSLGSTDAYLDYLYANTIFAKPEELVQIHDFSEIVNDPYVELAMSVIAVRMKLRENLPGYEMVNEYERLLGDAIREMNHDKDYYPDANFTMRLSYGLCRPIDGALLAAQKAKSKGQNGMLEQTDLDVSTLNAEGDKLFTTVQTFLDKHEKNPNALDFALTSPVYKWMKSGKFSKQYLDKRTGKLPLCFLTTNDITGGNSGSGMFDGKGRLIGLAFDGNWEAMSGDIKFDNALQRTIGVDIRWVLSVIDDYSHAKRLINELTIE